MIFIFSTISKCLILLNKPFYVTYYTSVLKNFSHCSFIIRANIFLVKYLCCIFEFVLLNWLSEGGEMILFLISLILVSTSAFFIANLLDSKKTVNNIIYFFLSAFAQIILALEVLSLFSAISVQGMLFTEGIIFILSLALWITKKRPVIGFNFYDFFRKILYSIKSDKLLAVLMFGFIFMLAAAIFLVIILPSNDASAITYHVVRSLFWIEHGNLNHFNIADAKAVVFPVNSELLYTWVLLFLKKDVFLSGFSFLSFILYIVSLWGILAKFTTSIRKKLWVIFIVSSFTAVAACLASTETNIMIAALTMTALYLIIDYVKSENKPAFFMSALAAAVSMGVKTSAFFIMPAVFVFFIAAAYHYKTARPVKKFILWMSVLLINFLIFSSYNYILNFINYGNFISNQSVMQAHKNLFGFKGFIFNCINYFVMMFRFSEFDGIYNFSNLTFEILKKLLRLFNEPFLLGRYTNDYTFKLINADRSGLGINGILIYFPCLICSLCGLRRKNKRVLISLFSIMFLIPFILMAYSVVYMAFNIRFIVVFALISAPVILYSYTKKLSFYKILTTCFACIGFFYISLNITNKNVPYLVNYLRHGYSAEAIRETAMCTGISGVINNNYKNIYCKLRDYIKDFNQNNRILYLSQETDGLLMIKLLQLKGYHIDVDLIENFENTDLEKYNFIITLENKQSSLMFNKLDKIRKGSYRGEGIYCNYNDIKGNLAFGINKSIPYISYCETAEDFWGNNNFKLFETLTFSETMSNYEATYKYYIYENIKNPIIK